MKFTRFAIVAVTLTASTAALAHGGRGYFKHADTDQDGKITREEARTAADARFADVDANKDGVISKAEAEAVKDKYRARFEQKADARFASKDTNNDGKLSRSEVPRMPEELFKKLDTNSDGALTKEEMRAHGPGRQRPEGAPQRSQGKHLSLFDKMDANKDGNVTLAEAQAASDEHFSRLDKNSDGAITKDELPGKGRRGHHKGHGQKGANRGAPSK